MPEHAARFLQGAGLVTFDEQRGERATVDPAVCRILHVVADLEADTAITVQHAHTLGVDRADDIAAFLPTWADEEAAHARVLRALLAGRTYVPPMPAPPAIARSRRLAARVPRKVFGRLRATGLVYCTLGAAAEFVTVIVYRELTAMVDDDLVATLLRDINRQERRHCAFFVAAARERADRCSSLDVRLARRLLIEMWEPPGVPSLGIDAWRDTFAPLVDDVALRTRVEAMDRVVDAIPHLGGLDLMARFLDERVPLAA